MPSKIDNRHKVIGGKLLATLPRDFIHDKTNTELIAISMEELGTKEAA